MQGVDGRDATDIPYSDARAFTWALVMCSSARGLMIPSSLSAGFRGGIHAYRPHLYRPGYTGFPASASSASLATPVPPLSMRHPTSASPALPPPPPDRTPPSWVGSAVLRDTPVHRDKKSASRLNRRLIKAYFTEQGRPNGPALFRCVCKQRGKRR